MTTNQTDNQSLETLSSQLSEVVARTAPSVVRIDDGSRLTATGMAWCADGLVVATSHGTETDDNLSIITGDGTRLSAKLVGRDDESDIALLRVDGGDLSVLPVADESAVGIGQIALAIGRPGNFGLQATFGIVGSKQEMDSQGNVEYLIGTDATLYPGYSGGPLVDATGALIGINNRSFGRGQSIAIGATLVGHVVESLLAQGTVTRGYLGVSTQAVTLPENLRATLAIPQRVGLMVVQLAQNGPAEKAGMTIGDTILGLDGESLEDVDDLRAKLRQMQSGSTVALQIIRGGQIKDVTAELGSLA